VKLLIEQGTDVNDVVGAFRFQFALFFIFCVCGECFSTGIVFVDQGILVSFPYLPMIPFSFLSHSYPLTNLHPKTETQPNQHILKRQHP